MSAHRGVQDQILPRAGFPSTSQMALAHESRLLCELTRWTAPRRIEAKRSEGLVRGVRRHFAR
eukprot:11892720-Alexandrium_andersonii.AAC.1